MQRPKGSSNSSTSKADSAGEQIAPYFRKVFSTNRKLLVGRSNKEVLKMWLADHPGYAEVPENVRASMGNVKSNMRSKLHTRRRKKVAAEEAAGAAVGKSKTSPLLSVNAADNDLEKLEILIDNCLTIARSLDRKGRLNNVVGALRIARNRVVWKLGED
jgi:hypothetical protein